MKSSLVTLAIVLCTAAFTGGSANAQNYPWCADYGGRMGGASNCGFATLAQCQAALSGNGGFCNRNTQYSGNGPVYHYRPRRRHYED